MKWLLIRKKPDHDGRFVSRQGVPIHWCNSIKRYRARDRQRSIKTEGWPLPQRYRDPTTRQGDFVVSGHRLNPLVGAVSEKAA